MSLNISLSANKNTPLNTGYKDISISPEKRAEIVLAQMTPDEKKHFVTGYNHFFTFPLKRFGLRSAYMTDATAGVHIRRNLDSSSHESIAYPCASQLAAAWNKQLAWLYGNSIGKECRELGSDFLLGPGMNLYRVAPCGRNFEYFGEDPILTATIATQYIKGLQKEKVIATAKHYICNNHEWLRHISNSVVDERTLHEIYMIPWYYVVHNAETGAIMSSYNVLNGEKVSQSAEALKKLLRNDIGFNGIIMSDWGAVYDGEKALQSGIDLIMPHGKSLEKIKIESGSDYEKDLDRMCLHILTTMFKFGIFDRERKNPDYMSPMDRKNCEKIALDTAREGICLLKNNGVLPLSNKIKGKIVLLGPAIKNTRYTGDGSGKVAGYDHKNIESEFIKTFGQEHVMILDWENAYKKQISTAEAVVVCVQKRYREGWDELPYLDEKQEALIKLCLENSKKTIVVILSGSGIKMKWSENAAAILWCMYPGQYGGRAIAEIISGKVNPSGKLPYTIENDFKDSPACGYRPKGTTRFQSKYKSNPIDQALPPHPKVEYKEGVLLGYRWYDSRKIPVRFPFGHGLSYTTFTYSNLKVDPGNTNIKISLQVTNSGKSKGKEVVQIYIAEQKPTLLRPEKELKDFAKIAINPGETKNVEFSISPHLLSYYDIKEKKWIVNPGKYTVYAGSSSRDIKQTASFEWTKPMKYILPVNAKNIQ
jgi:beta-glucosidase